MGTAVRRGRVTRSSLIYPEDFGAIGNGIADDYTALQAALNALTSSKTLVINAGKTFNHSNYLTWSTSGTIRGTGIINATVETASALKITGNNQQIIDVEFACPTTARGVTYEEMRICALGATNLRLTNTLITGARAAGYFLEGCSYCVLDRIRLTGGRADGVHFTGGSHHMYAFAPDIRNAGDDGVACVSYYGGGPQFANHDIFVYDPYVFNTLARGVSIVGGHEITYLNVTVDGCTAAGVYIAAEHSAFHTENVSNTLVTIKDIANANSSGAIDHGDIFFFAEGAASSVASTIVRGIGAAGYGTVTSSDSVSAFHIGGNALNAAATITASVQDLRITPNDAKTIVANFGGGTSNVTSSNVSY